MPMPSPTSGESKKAFIKRFMSANAMQKEYPDPLQRYAVAESLWDRRNKDK